jgi:23S rRNA (adenine-N6)-dimethyltransferase
VSGGRQRWWGFHQLDNRWAALLVEDAAVAPGDLVLDIGAGHGALTAALIGAGARVVAIELHDERAGYLRDRFEAAGVIVVLADARDLRLPRRPFRVVANPPFAVTTALIRRLVAPGSRLLQADLVVPAHVAARWTSPDAPGARRWGESFAASVERSLPRRAFHPPATQPTVVLRLRARLPAPRQTIHGGEWRRRRGRPGPRPPSRLGSAMGSRSRLAEISSRKTGRIRNLQ